MLLIELINFFLLFQIEKLQAKIEARESELADKLEKMERKQHLALEYMSSETSSLAASPTISRSEVKESYNTPESPVKTMPEMKVKSAPSHSDATCDVIGAKGGKQTSPDLKNTDDSAKNRNTKVKDNNSDNKHKSAENDGDNCIKHDDIATLKPVGFRD